jgi:phage tail sheath protein FI
MAFNIGINVIETDGSAAPAIAGAPTSVAGFVLRSRRGPTDQAVRVSNFRQFTARFGSYHRDFVGTYCVDGFFLNGGQEAYIARVLGSGSAAASVTLQGRNGSNTLLVTAGYRNTPEQGTWGNDLYIGVRDNPIFSSPLTANLAGNQPARLQGVAIAAPIDLSVPSTDPPKTLVIGVDTPATAITVTFDNTTLPVPAQATAQDIVDAINAQAGQRLVASVEASGILLVSRRKGTTSNLDLTATANTTLILLGFAPGPATKAGAASTNPSYTQVQVDSIAGFEVGNWVRLDDGISQNWHQITNLLKQEDGGGNSQFFVQWAEPLEAERNEYRTADNATLSTCEFDLVIQQLTAAAPNPQTVETWEKLTLDATQANYAALRVNDPFSGSAYIVLTDLNPAAFNGRDVPPPVGGIRLGIATPSTNTLTRVAGNDGNPPATSDYRNALSRFDTTAIQLLATPEQMPDGVLKAVTRAAIDYCAEKGDCMFVGHTPASRDVDGAKAFGQDFRAAKVYGALYWPWITITDPIGSGSNPTKDVPPTGHVMGVYARIDQTRGVWKAPAGNEAVVRGALAVERNITDTDHTDLVKNGSINGIRLIRGAGIVIDASRTLSTDTRWFYVNIRLLFNYVKASLREGLRWVKQEPNRDTLWNKIKFNAVTPFLLRLYQAGAFGTGTPSEVFTVICGPENNPPDEIALGNLRVEVYFYPARPAETILIIVGQQESGASASDR